MKRPDETELSKSKIHLSSQIVEYTPGGIASKVILKKPTGSIIAVSVPIGESIREKGIPFDTFIQLIEGTADIYIESKKYTLKSGCCIIVPAHATHSITSNKQFKMMYTIIKSGYES